MSEELVTNLRGLVLARPVILDALSKLLRVDGAEILAAVKAIRPLASLRPSEVSDAAIIDCVSRAFQTCAPASNPLSSARCALGADDLAGLGFHGN
jgi:hypothetical protein